MKMFSKAGFAALIAVFLLFALQLNASAHVTVKPLQAVAGTSETYTVTVPTEKEIPTTKIVLQIPTHVTFYSYQPVPGWTAKAVKNSKERVQTVTWTATGAGIAPGAFQQFEFRALNPEKTGSITWNAYQTYKDGSIVEWTGKEDAETPHAITKVVKSTAETDTKKSKPNANQTLSVITLVSSLAALVFSVLALIVALNRKRENRETPDHK
ncbi:YcnI family protein [Sporolactobacillus shoreicorticis]|uniref:YcnI family protein n=1 Tax=Sporolactobacillus shoreicorticis TaxID=1923877 RepID=A0ABW5S4P2_9BACL|nr:YcnI family protein [Sporolactobacillus shoreicorticis]MCO7124352.1 YcnI family protein [Sporolactobacillus shoreicorticis]